MKAYTSINDYLMKCIKNNYHCQHCAKNHNGICFFAFECFMDNMKYYDDGDEDENNHDYNIFDYYSAIDKDW